MKLRPEQLGQHLAGPLAPLYAVYGDEPLLVQETADQIRAAAAREGFGERELFVVETGFGWENLLYAGNSLSLFAAKRLLDLRIPSGKPGAEGGRALERFCAALPADTVTLISLPALPRASQASAWFKALERVGTTIAIYPVERARLPQWIRQRLAQQGQQADAEALAFLAERVEGNLLAARQEVQKLGLLLPPGELSFSQVKEAVLDVARYDVFQLGDAMLAGDAGRLARMLEGLEGEGTAPTLVLWTMSREIRTLAVIRERLRGGAALPELLRSARIWDSRRPLVERALRRLGEPALRAAARRAAALDRLIKGLRGGDAWDELLQLGLLLATGADTARAWDARPLVA